MRLLLLRLLLLLTFAAIGRSCAVYLTSPAGYAVGAFFGWWTFVAYIYVTRDEPGARPRPWL